MSDKPILFSAPMVRAILEGSKTQTRRIMKPQPDELGDGSCRINGHLGNTDYLMRQIAPKFWARVRQGDRLYVRETWSGLHTFRDTPPSQRQSVMTPDGPILREDIWFWADGSPTGGDYEKPRPGIHMPRWASRITLVVTGVKVERLQDCSNADAIAEGIEPYSGIDPECFGYLNYANNSEDGYWLPPIQSYRSLWNSINGTGAWEANPWVAAYSFTVIQKNIDQIAEAT